MLISLPSLTLSFSLLTSNSEPCLNVQLKDITSGKYKNATYTKYEAHVEKGKGEWVRAGKGIFFFFLSTQVF